MERGALTMLIMASAIVCGAAAPGPDARVPLEPNKIFDFALELDASAISSLRASGDEDVPGRLSLARNADEGAPVAVTVHLKGQRGSKRSIDGKPAFVIKMKDRGRLLGRERLTLNNMVQDPTMLHEALGYQVYAAAGVPVPATSYVRLTLNGAPYGLYLLVESIDRQFLAQRFGDDSGILYEGGYGADLREADVAKFELDEGDDPGRAKLRQLIRAVAAEGDGVFYGDGALVDTPSFLSMMAVQSLIGDWDNYYSANNYRLYWNPSAGRWSFIPTGLDQAFSDRTTLFDATGLLFQKCLMFERCTAQYIEAARDVIDRFERLNLPGEMDRLVTAIDAASRADKKRNYSTATMANARERLRRFLTTRPGVMRTSVDRGRPSP
jgi:hypothetical protein